jgi:hypothetical protein
VIPDLKFVVNAYYFVGLGLIATALALFSFKSWREERALTQGAARPVV